MSTRTLTSVLSLVCASMVIFTPSVHAAPPQDFLQQWMSFSSGFSAPGQNLTPHKEQSSPKPQPTAITNYHNISKRLPRPEGAVGSPIAIDHVQGKICRTFDAYGVKIIAAGPGTSCPFAINTFAASMADADPSTNVHYQGRPTVSVKSAVTGKKYTMKCTEYDSSFFECKDTHGGTATVWAW